MVLDTGLLSVIAVILLIICIFSYPDKLNIFNLNIEKMTGNQIINDFEKSLREERTEYKEGFASLTNSEFMKPSCGGWQLYAQSPFYELKSHPKKTVFYEKPIYRKPYRYPFGYEQSYPYPHFSHFKN